MPTYTEVSITGYNSNPPEDDGTEASSNEVSWSKHKTKIGDPLKTAIEDTQTNVQSLATAITAELIESGTAMLFMQSAAPTGWTKDTTANLNDTALRVTTGTVSSRTDQKAFATAFGSVSTDATTLALSQIPSHSHSNGSLDVANHAHEYDRATDSSFPTGSGKDGANDSPGANSSFESPDVTGSTANNGGGGSHDHGLDMRVNYHDVIKATKD